MAAGGSGQPHDDEWAPEQGEPTSNWVLVYEGVDPAREGLREALCTLGNGYFATRGAAPEAHADEVHYPGTYVAGCYDRLTTEVAGRSVENEDLVNVPNWLPLTFRLADGEWFDVRRLELLGYRQELDLRRGVLSRVVRARDPAGRVTGVTQRRFVDMSRPHLAALEISIVGANWSGPIEVRSALDGTVTNCGVARYQSLRGDHLVPVEQGDVGDDAINLQVQTRQSRMFIAEAARTRVTLDGRPVSVRPRLVAEPGFVAHQWCVEVGQAERLTVEKVIALHTSRDHAISEAGLAARTAVEEAGGFADLLVGHVLAWDQLWRRFDLPLAGQREAELALRVHIFHLLQTVSPNSIGLDCGVPARGLHGEAYRGHIFWDELFVFPLLNLRLPVLTRSMLDYRVRRLAPARRAARREGHAGAMFPWQSGSDGGEETQALHLNPRSGRWLPDNSRLQRHIGIAIAYNVWSYYQVTGDVEFLRFRGAPMIIEVARFLADLAAYNDALDRYEINGVMGPDEYHDGYPGSDVPGLDNNAYTNVMTVWVVCRALEVIDLLPDHHARELWDQLGLTTAEVSRWDDISRKMRVCFHDDGVISQFEGYDRLEELDWLDYQERYGDIQRLDRILEAEGDSANRYKVSKQADVLMILYLLSAVEVREIFHRLGYPFDPPQDWRSNVEYYMARTSHGSTLSWVVHSWVLARLDRRRSWELLLQALKTDIADIQGGTTHEGIHLGAMAGTVDLIQRCYGGLEARGDVLWLDPALPNELPALRFLIHYRGHRVDIDITRRRLRVGVLPALAPPIRIGFGGEVVELGGGASKEWPLTPVGPPTPRPGRDHGRWALGTWGVRLGGVVHEWRVRR
jgi:trehalose/maltose hydrolase-like predicted phosphorylase